jgi:hypothetical protein
MSVVITGWIAEQLQVGTVTGGISDALAKAGVTYPNPQGTPR